MFGDMGYTSRHGNSVQDVKGGGILGHGAEQKCTTGTLVFSINVTLRRASVGALSWSECGGLCVSRIAGSAHGSGLPTLLEAVALAVHLKDVNLLGLLHHSE